MFSREFKAEAVRLVRERGVRVGQAAKAPGIHENVLRNSVKATAANREQTFLGSGRMKPDDADLARLRRELAKTKTERDIPRIAIAHFAKEPH